MTETAGIIGAGVAGQAIARFFLTAGRNVVISNSRGPDSLGEVIADLGAGAQAGTTAQAAQAPLVVLATPWAAVEDILAALPSWSGRTLVDATNAFKVFDPPTVELFDFGDRTSSEVVASLAPGASVVKAFNHVPFTQLLSPPPTASSTSCSSAGTTPRPRPAFAQYSKRTTSPPSTLETWPPVRASSKRAAPSTGWICALLPPGN